MSVHEGIAHDWYGNEVDLGVDGLDQDIAIRIGRKEIFVNFTELRAWMETVIKSERRTYRQPGD